MRHIVQAWYTRIGNAEGALQARTPSRRVFLSLLARFSARVMLLKSRGARVLSFFMPYSLLPI